MQTLFCSFRFEWSSLLPQSRLPPEVNRILYVRNLPFKITAEELYAIFGKYGAVYQIRLGDRNKDTRGTAFVVYEDIYDAKAAVDHLSGFNVGGRYLVVLVCFGRIHVHAVKCHEVM